MNLNLSKPLALIDLETTGVSVGSDRIVEFSVLKINVDGKKEIYTQRVNPEMPIPIKSSEIHGIYDADIANEPTFKQIAHKLNEFIKNCDFAGYNSNKFDIPLLAEEFLRVDVDFDLKNRRLVDVQNIFHIMEPRTLAAAYKFYCGKEIENAHSAEADIAATYEVLEAQITKYSQLENNIDFLADFSMKTKNVDLAGRIIYNEKKEEVFSFGKYKDQSVEAVFKKEPSYYDWMMKGDFPLYTKKVITAIRLRAFNSK